MGWRKGEEIVNVEPYVHVLSQQHRGTRCDNCFSCCISLKRCSACHVLRYCSSNCQRKDWDVHKVECKCLKWVSPKIPTESVRLMLRLLIRLQHGGASIPDSDSAKWRKFTDLQSHAEEIQQDKQRSEILHQMTFTLSELAGDFVSLSTGQELLEVYGRMVINTYSICDGEMQPIGSGLYISPSLVDHCCHPNAVAVFSGTNLLLRCIEDIPSGDPKQVFVSYVDQLAPSCERQKQMEEQYYFTCQCQRCLEPEMDALMLSGQCPQVNCSGVLLPANSTAFHPCKSCQSLVSDITYISNIHKVIEESKDAVLKLDDLKKDGDPEIRLQFCQNLIRKQSVLSPYNVYRVKTLDRAMDACIDACQWEKAEEYGRQTVKPYLKLHPPNTPTVGIQLMKLGKLQLYLQKLSEATESLQQAESILSVTHGKSHAVYTDLCELLDQCAEQRRVQLEHIEDG